MWARYCEALLGVWLMASPWVFGHASADEWRAWHDIVCGAAIVLVAVLTHHPSLERLHLALLPLATWLSVAGWWVVRAGAGATAAYESWIVVGLTLAMFAILPSHASQPPASWRGGLRTGNR
jgi:hypothetical protein